MMNDQELIIVSDSEPRDEASLEPVVAVPESDEDWEMDDEPEHLEFTDRNIILEDVKREVTNFILQLPTPLDVGEFKEQYTTHGSLPVAELDPRRWGWASYSSMIKGFSKTEDFEIVSATRVTKEDFSQDRHFWCFALDPSNVDHWRYFFEGGFIKLKTGTLSIFNIGAKVKQTNNRSLPQPPILPKSVEKSTRVEDASNRSRKSRGSKPLPDTEECVQLYGKGTCFEFQKAMCFRGNCKYRHNCANCLSAKHGAESAACPKNIRKAAIKRGVGNGIRAKPGVNRKDLVEPMIKKNPMNNKKNSVVDEGLTSLELAEMIAAVGNDEPASDGRGAQQHSRGPRRRITSASNVKKRDPLPYRRKQASGHSNSQPFRSPSVRSQSYQKGYCYKFQVGECENGNSCPFKHQCTWCNASHRGSICPRSGGKAGGPKPIARQSRPSAQAVQTPIRSNGSFRGVHDGQQRARGRSSTSTNSYPKPAAREAPLFSNSYPKPAAREAPLFSKPAVAPLFSKPVPTAIFSKAAQPMMQKPLTNSYDAMPSGSGGGYNRASQSGGYNRTTQQGRPVNRRRPY